MSKINEEQQRIEYLKQQEFYTQITLESKMKELTLLLDTYQITDKTELSTFEIAILSLKQRIDAIINQLLILKQQELSASHYSKIEFEKIEINNVQALFTTARVDRDYIPQGYYAYDVRSSGKKEFATIEPFAKVDYTGTILSKQLIEMGTEGCVPITSHNFLGKTVIGYYLTQVTTNIQELIGTYESRNNAFLENIERSPNSLSSPVKQTAPSFVKEILIPIHLGMEEYLREKKIEVKIPDPNTYCPIVQYFRIKVGGKTVGGFSAPNGDYHSLYFTSFNRTTPIGERVKVTDIEQLCQLILAQLNQKQQRL